MDSNPIMSGAARTAIPDRRRQRTRASLVRSFTELMFDRRYDSFGVAEIAARANIGRSTFYDHFGGKDALLREAMQPILDVLADAAAGSVAPERLRGVIDHLWQNRRMGRIIFGVPMRSLVERQLANLVEARLGPKYQLASMQIAAAQLCILDAWTSGTISSGADAIIESVTVTALLAQTAAKH